MDLPDSLGHSSSRDVSSPILRLWRLFPSSDDSAGSKAISGTSPSSCTPAMLVHVSHLADALLDTVYLPHGQRECVASRGLGLKPFQKLSDQTAFELCSGVVPLSTFAAALLDLTQKSVHGGTLHSKEENRRWQLWPVDELLE